MSKKIVILGGGLWGGLLAYFFHLRQPHLEVELYERDERLGGDHTWSFHTSDVDAELWPFIKPLVSHSWDSQAVFFPKLTRELSLGYHSILSGDFDRKLRELLPKAQILLGQAREPEDFGDDCVVFDTRNLKGISVPVGFQNFVGLDVELEAPHGLTRPVIMDAKVEQIDSFRFVYYLPWSATRVLVEDTRYTLQREIAVEEWKEEVLRIIAGKSWRVKSIERVEVGSLPIPFEPMRSDFEERANRISLRAIFQDVTGYSIADALRVADVLSRESSGEYARALNNYLAGQKWRRRFYRLLNRLMFKAAPASERYRMLQHFYRLPQPLIERFYAGQTRGWDVMRVFLGKPPVSVWRALRVLIGI